MLTKVIDFLLEVSFSTSEKLLQLVDYIEHKQSETEISKLTELLAAEDTNILELITGLSEEELEDFIDFILDDEV